MYVKMWQTDVTTGYQAESKNLIKRYKICLLVNSQLEKCGQSTVRLQKD